MSSPICFLVPLYAYCLSHSWECYESYLDILPYNAKPWGGTVVDCSSRDSVGTPGGVPPLNVISMFAWGGVSLHVYPPKKCKLHIKRSRPVLRVGGVILGLDSLQLKTYPIAKIRRVLLMVGQNILMTLIFWQVVFSNIIHLESKLM